MGTLGDRDCTKAKLCQTPNGFLFQCLRKEQENKYVDNFLYPLCQNSTSFLGTKMVKTNPEENAYKEIPTEQTRLG